MLQFLKLVFFTQPFHVPAFLFFKLPQHMIHVKNAKNKWQNE